MMQRGITSYEEKRDQMAYYENRMEDLNKTFAYYCSSWLSVNCTCLKVSSLIFQRCFMPYFCMRRKKTGFAFRSWISFTRKRTGKRYGYWMKEKKSALSGFWQRKWIFSSLAYIWLCAPACALERFVRYDGMTFPLRHTRSLSVILRSGSGIWTKTAIKRQR